MREILICVFTLLCGIALGQGQLELCDEAGTFTKNTDGSYFFSSDLRYGEDVSELTVWMQRLNEALRNEGMLLIVVPTPRRATANGGVVNDQAALDALEIDFDWQEAQAYHHDYVASLAPIVAVDLLGTAMSFNGKTPGYFFKYDQHWTPEGARASAEAVARTLLASPLYTSLSSPQPTEFVTTQTGIMEAPNRIFYIAEEKCSDLPDSLMEMKPLYETEPVEAEQDLFASTTPFVTLVGTSFSREDYNFAGFLSEALDQDVLNSSVSGGGLFTSLEDYLLNRTPETQAQVIIWEHRMSDTIGASWREDFFVPFRQLIASAYGSCEAQTNTMRQKTPVAGFVLASTDLSGPTFTIFKNPSGSAIYGEEYYLQLQASDLALVEFELTLRHQDGSVETVPIERSTRISNNGRFYLELSREIASPLQDVSMTVPAGIEGTIEAQICQVPRG